MSAVMRLKDGRYMAVFHDDGRFIANSGERGPFVVYRTVSNDGGLTWGTPQVIARHPQAQPLRGAARLRLLGRGGVHAGCAALGD